MATKIFPFKPRKIKQPKPPDPEIDRLFQETEALRQHIKTQRDERHKIMAELYAEDLAHRAERYQARKTKRRVEEFYAKETAARRAENPDLPIDKPICPCCGLNVSKYTEALIKQKWEKDLEL